MAATLCPLILAAPVACIADVAQAARIGILIKGGKQFEALACVKTVIFDKTKTFTVGRERPVAVEAAPGDQAEDVMRIASSLEQASKHVVASAIVQAARGKDINLGVPSGVTFSYRPAQAGGRPARPGPYSRTKPPKAATQATLAATISTIEPLKAATIRRIAAQNTSR